MKNKLPPAFTAVRRPPAGYRAKNVAAKSNGKLGPNTQSDEQRRAHQNNEGHQGGQHAGSHRKT